MLVEIKIGSYHVWSCSEDRKFKERREGNVLKKRINRNFIKNEKKNTRKTEYKSLKCEIWITEKRGVYKFYVQYENTCNIVDSKYTKNR